ncbi:BioY family transporter [Terrihabitans soli]|uniref:Biotin transporter n=1 Tax=Terrihabitans soli TaxID=708113 RepID=A0A6S6QWQ5_9HYPH|nr:biotin transporter BioY [Terrihabitans soli]BCJ91481.1 BioY family transporter [Terrihabitans soli]
MLRDIGLILLFAAIIALLGLVPRIDLPMLGGVPITAQSMGVTLAGVMIGARRGALAAAVFLIAVAFGLPLLAGGRGGIEVFQGPTAGFLLGFIPAAFLTGMLFEALSYRMGVFFAALIAAFIGGYVVLNLLGIPVMAYLSDKTVREAVDVALGLLPGGIVKALGTAVLAYLAGGMEPLGRR